MASVEFMIPMVVTQKNFLFFCLAFGGGFRGMVHVYTFLGAGAYWEKNACRLGGMVGIIMCLFYLDWIVLCLGQASVAVIRPRELPNQKREAAGSLAWLGM